MFFFFPLQIWKTEFIIWPQWQCPLHTIRSTLFTTILLDLYVSLWVCERKFQEIFNNLNTENSSIVSWVLAEKNYEGNLEVHCCWKPFALCSLWLILTESWQSHPSRDHSLGNANTHNSQPYHGWIFSDLKLSQWILLISSYTLTEDLKWGP